MVQKFNYFSNSGQTNTLYSI